MKQFQEASLRVAKKRKKIVKVVVDLDEDRFVTARFVRMLEETIRAERLAKS